MLRTSHTGQEYVDEGEDGLLDKINEMLDGIKLSDIESLPTPPAKEPS